MNSPSLAVSTLVPCPAGHDAIFAGKAIVGAEGGYWVTRESAEHVNGDMIETQRQHRKRIIRLAGHDFALLSRRQKNEVAAFRRLLEVQPA